jgi:hypothetical protein
MNVWALDKDNAIRRLLLILSDRFGSDAFAISGQWEKEVNAVGIYRPGEESLCAYLFTYGQETGRYGLHLEYPGVNGFSTSTQMIEGIGLNHLIELLQAHFDIELRQCG